MDLKFYARIKTASASVPKKLALVFLSSIFYFGNATAQTPATALHFDGVDDRVQVPANPSLNISSNITIEAWINYSKISGTQDVICKSSSAVNNSYIFPRTSDGWRTVEFLLNLNGQGWQTLKVTYSGSSNSKRNQWHHLAATYDGFFMRIYIDGVLAGSQAKAGTITVNNNPLIIGGQTGYTDEYYQGKLDDIRIWNRALSGCEISSTMSCELTASSQTGLAAYYKFNQGFVNLVNLLSPVLDETTNANNGTLLGFLLSGLTSNWTDGTVSGNCGVFTPVNAVAGAVATSLAIGSDIELTASGGDTYSWTGPNGFTSTLQNPVIPGVGQNASGTYTVTATKNGCSANASVSIIVADRAKSLDFDGRNDVIRIPNAAPFNSPNAMSLEMWVKPTSNLPLVQNVVAKSTFNQNNSYVFPRTDDGWQSFSFWLAVNGQWKVVSAPFASLNNWTHVAATYDGFFMRIYMNGNLVGSLSAPGTITINSNDISIGQQDGYNQEFYKGGLDELRFWNRALTQCEIQHNQNCELNGDNNGIAGINGLVGYYRFNQGLVDVDNSAYTVLADSSVNHNNGTLQNFSLTGAAGSNWTTGGNVNNSSCSPYVASSATATSNGPVIEVGSTVQLFASDGSAWAWTGPQGFTSTLQNPTIPNSTTDRTGNYSVTVTNNGCTAVASTKLTVAYKAGTLRFDGVNDQVRIPANNSLNITSAITLESWIYPTNNTRQVQDVVGKSTNSVNSGYIFPRTDDAWGSYVFYLHLNGAWQKLSAPYPAINEWHHVAATYDGYFMRIYLDGVLSASKEVEGDITVNGNDLMLGQQEGFNEYFEGSVEETRIWNRALNQCEIINNKNCELDVTQQNGLVAYFKYNQGFVNAPNTGINTVIDASGNANNGSLENFALDGLSSNWSDFKINGTCAVFSLPPVTAASNGSIFGIGSTIKLFASGGFSYTWDGPNGFSSALQNPTITNVQPAQSGTYTVTAPFVNCVVTASTRLSVSALAPINADGPTTFCPSGSVTLSSSNEGSAYQWFLNNVAINGATSNAYVATQSGNYTISVTTPKDVLVSEPIVITVQDNLAPQPTVAQLPTLNLVTPATVTEFPTALDNCAGLVTATTVSPLNYLDQGVFTITWKYDDHNGNITYQDQQVIVVIGRDVIPPVLTVPANMNLSGNAAVCGAVANFAATATDNSKAPVTITYSQDPGTVFPVGTTTVTVTAADTSGNITTGTFTITVSPTLVAPITGTTTVCSGSTTQLSTASTGGSWSSADRSIATVDAAGMVTGVAGGSVAIIYTNACGATASATVTVRATPSAPVVTVADNCGSSTLSTNAAGSLVWSTGATTASITVAGAGSYTVTQTQNGCTSAAGSGTAAPKAIPAAPVVTVSNNCGASTLSTNAAGSLLWSNGSTASSITVNNNATYTVTQTVNGCTSAAGSGVAAPVAIPSAPVVTVTNNCANTTLSTNAAGNLLWSTGATTASITVANAGTYTVTQTVNGCTSPAGSANAAPKGFPAAPVVTVVDNCGTSTLTASGTNLVWSTGATGSSITVSNAGAYTATQTVNGCTSAAGSATAAPKAIPAAPVVTVVNNCGSSTLSTNAAGSLLWSNGSTAAAITVNNNATYTVTQTVNGCTSAAGSAVAAPIQIPSAPVVTVVDNCGSSTLSTNAAGSLLWNTGATSSSITVSSNGTYSVKQTVNGCTSTAGSAVAAPKAVPATPVISVVDNCGNSVLSTNASGNLLWSNGSTASTITVTASGNYTVTVTGPSGCSASSAVSSVTIKAYPVVPAITGTTVTTVGSSTQLANTTTGGVWSSSNTSVATVNASGLVTGAAIGTANITYTVTSAAGCATSVTTGITVNPNCVIPVLTAQNDVAAGTTASGCSAAVTYAVSVSGGSPAPAVTYTFTGATTGSGSGTGSGAVFNKGVTVVKVTASNTCGTVIRTFNVTVTDATAPVITAVPAQAACAGATSYTIPVLAASDNCGAVTISYAITGATSRTGTGNNASGAFNAGVSTITWTVKDAAGNTATSNTTVTINAIPVASITAGSADDFCSKLYLNGASSVSGASYSWTYGSASVGAGQQLSLGLNNGDGNYQLTVTANGCTSAPVSYNFQKQNFTGSYTILVYDDASLGKYNKVASGSIGALSTKADIRLRSYSSVTGPGSFVKGTDIRKDWGATVSSQIYGVATVTLPTMQYNTASAKYLPNYTAYSNNAILNGNYNSLTIKRNVSVTLTGNTFGTIRLEEGASVRFAANVLNIDNLIIDNGIKNNTYSYVRFAPNTAVRVSTRVSVGTEVVVNPDSYKVTFYMGDEKCDNNERFSVKGADVKVVANIIMPDGRLTVNGTDADNDDHEACDHKAHYSWNCSHKYHDHDDCDHKAHSESSCNDNIYMTGLFVVEDLDSKGNTVIWNSYDCATAAPLVLNSKSAKQSSVTAETTSKITTETSAVSEEDLKVTVLPNPSTTYFTLKFASRFETPINLRVMDASGRVVDAKSKIGSNSTLQIGHNYSSGSYFAEITQGGQRKVIQLIKARG
ncbi:MAG: HYR domain-containing protein [Chitinophagaceae bacterium]|nr:HYR domain-containing protein [Chitinophagaceae bacterium]